MEEEDQPPVSFMCSNCYTPCSGADAHVVPNWNVSQRRILTTYRCSNCWIQALDHTRDAVRSGDQEVVASFCEFMERQRFNDVDMLRKATPEEAERMILMVLDAVQNGRVEFDP